MSDLAHVPLKPKTEHISLGESRVYCNYLVHYTTFLFVQSKIEFAFLASSLYHTLISFTVS